MLNSSKKFQSEEHWSSDLDYHPEKGVTLRNHLIPLDLSFSDLKTGESGNPSQTFHYPLIFYEDNRQVNVCTYVIGLFIFM